VTKSCEKRVKVIEKEAKRVAKVMRNRLRRVTICATDWGKLIIVCVFGLANLVVRWFKLGSFCIKQLIKEANGMEKPAKKLRKERAFFAYFWNILDFFGIFRIFFIIYRAKGEKLEQLNRRAGGLDSVNWVRRAKGEKVEQVNSRTVE
jgi:hypothetical protein